MSESDRTMPRLYQYVKINDYYFCLQQNPVVLAWILFTKRADLNTVYTPWEKNKPAHGTLKHLQYLAGRFKANTRMVFFFSLSKFHLFDAGPPISLPCFGHICKHVHKGFKVFHLIRGTVTKIFDPDVSSASVRSEIERMKMVSPNKYAPAITGSNSAQRWYEEQYFSGVLISTYKSPDSSNLLQSFDHIIMPCLSALMTFREHRHARVLEYARELARTIDVSGNTSIRGLDSGDAPVLRPFVHSLLERLDNRGDISLCLAFSHGDFCPANMIITRGGMRLLDWESALYRSALFDFFSYFFYRPVCIDVPVEVMAREMEQAFPILLNRLSTESPDLERHLSFDEPAYRWLFYIECLAKLAERVHTDKNLDIADFIKRYINAFDQYEVLRANNDHISYASGQ